MYDLRSKSINAESKAKDNDTGANFGGVIVSIASERHLEQTGMDSEERLT
jgi:galactokinase